MHFENRKKSFGILNGWQHKVFPALYRELLRSGSFEEIDDFLHELLQETNPVHDAAFRIFLFQFLTYMHIKKENLPEGPHNAMDLLDYYEIRWYWAGDSAFLFKILRAPVFDEMGILIELRPYKIVRLSILHFSPFGMHEEEHYYPN